MGRHYRADVQDGPIGMLKALWNNLRSCQWVEPIEGAEGEEKGVLFFRNRNGMNMKPRAVKEGESLCYD